MVLRRVPASAAPDAAALATLAALLAAQGRLEESASHAARALASGPLPAGLVVSLADSLARAHQHELADRALAAAIDAGDNALELRLSRGRLAERRGRTDLALRHWQRVLALAPDHLETRLGLIRALRVEGRHAEAETACRHVIAATPTDPRAHAELARIALDAGDPVEAESRWHAALLAHPGHLAALLGLARALTAQHRFTDARQLLSELAATTPSRRKPWPHWPARRWSRAMSTPPAKSPMSCWRCSRASWRPRCCRAGCSRPRAGSTRRPCSTGGWRRSSPVAEPMLASAELAARRGDRRGAGAFAALARPRPGHIEAQLGLAGALAELGLGHEDAEAVAAQALALAPTSPGHICAGRDRGVAGRWRRQGWRCWRPASAMPHREEPLLQLARLAVRHGKLDPGGGTCASPADGAPAEPPGTAGVLRHGLGPKQPEMRGRSWPLWPASCPSIARCSSGWPASTGRTAPCERARRRAALVTRHDPRLHGTVDPIDRLDRHPLPAPQGEVRAFLLVRNERDRLPWLLEYYRGLGVDRFLLLDNDSDDGTRDWLLAQGPDLHLFHTEASFAASGAGMRWMNRLLDEHGSGAWCLTVDADEALVYPHCETFGWPGSPPISTASGPRRCWRRCSTCMPRRHWTTWPIAPGKA